MGINALSTKYVRWTSLTINHWLVPEVRDGLCLTCLWWYLPDTPLLSYFLPHRWSLRSSVIRTFILIDVRFFHLVFKESLSEQWSRHGGWSFFWMEVCLGICNECQMSKVHPEDSIWSENKSWLRVANIQLSVSMFPSWCPWNQSIRFVRLWHLSLRRDLMWITELGLTVHSALPSMPFIAIPVTLCSCTSVNSLVL